MDRFQTEKEELAEKQFKKKQDMLEKHAWEIHETKQVLGIASTAPTAPMKDDQRTLETAFYKEAFGEKKSEQAQLVQEILDEDKPVEEEKAKEPEKPQIPPK